MDQKTQMHLVVQDVRRCAVRSRQRISFWFAYGYAKLCLSKKNRISSFKPLSSVPCKNTIVFDSRRRDHFALVKPQRTDQWLEATILLQGLHFGRLDERRCSVLNRWADSPTVGH